MENSKINFGNLEITLNNNKEVRVMTFGTFDLFHIGHVNIIEKPLRILNEKVKIYIGVSSDNWNKLKGKQAHQSQEERVKIIKAKYPNAEVFLEDHTKPEETWPMLWDKYNIDIIVMGGDHRDNLDYINKTITPKGNRMKIIFFDRTPGISSTKLRENLK